MKIKRPVGKRAKACLLIAVVLVLVVSAVYIYLQKYGVGGRSEPLIESFEDKTVTTERVTNRTIIRVRNPKDIEGIVSKIRGAKLVRTYGNFPDIFVIETGWDEMEFIKNDPNVISATEDKFLYISLDDSVPQIQANMTYKMGETRYDRFAGQGVKVALLDTGVNTSHPAFQDSVINGLNGSKFINWTDCSFGQAWQDDLHGHGTHTSGIIGSNDSTTRGVAPDASLLMGMVCDYTGSCGYSAIICGFDWAINNSVNVVSMSIGGDADSIDDGLIEAVQVAIEHNITVVMSQGNSGEGIGSIPANAWNAIGVGAVSKSDVIASWSSGNVIDEGLAKPDVSAPGVSINSTICQEMWGGGYCNTSGFAEMSGTSMAAPHIAGVAAIYHQAYKNDTNEFPRPLIVKSAIERGTIDLGAIGKDIRYGVGRVSVDKVLNIFYKGLNISENATTGNYADTFMASYQSNETWNGTDWSCIDLVQTYTIILNESNKGNVGDAYIDGTNPNFNYGNFAYLGVGNSNNMMNSFYLWNLSLIPQDSIITDAEMSIYITSYGGKTNVTSFSAYNTSVYNATNAGPWREGTANGIDCGSFCDLTQNITFKNKPTINTFQSYNNTPVLGIQIWVNFTVTNATIVAFTGTPNKNMSITIINSTIAPTYDYFFVDSKESSISTSQRPQLIITYQKSSISCPVSSKYLNATIYGGIELGFNANSSDATSATCTLMNYNSTSWKANFTFDCPLLSGKFDYIYRTNITGTVGTYWELAMNTSTSLSYLHFTHFWARENTSQTTITESLFGLGRDKEFVVSSPVPLNFESKNDTVAIFNFTMPQQAENALFITYWEEDLNKDGIHYVFSTTLAYPNGTNATFNPIYNDTTIMSNISAPLAGDWKLYVTLEGMKGMLNITGDNNIYLGVSYNISLFVKSENATGWARNDSIYINESIGTAFYRIYYNSTLSPVSLSFKRIIMQPSALTAGFNAIYGTHTDAFNKVVFEVEKDLNRNFTTANDTFWDNSMPNSIPFTQLVEYQRNLTSNQTTWNITLNSSLGLSNATVWINLNNSMTINQLTVELLNSTGGYEILTPVNRCNNTNISAAVDTNFTSVTTLNGEVWQMCWGKTAYNSRSQPNFFKYVIPTISTNRTLRVYGEAAKIFLVQPANNTPVAAGQQQNISLRFMAVHRSLLLNCSLILDGLVNQTRTSIANGTVAEFNVSVDQKDYAWRVNCTGD